MNIKQKLHKFLFPDYSIVIRVQEKYIDELKNKSVDLEDIYNKNKDTFESLLVKDFTGYVPKEINEPSMRIFEDNGEMIQRWILWQSYYINRKAINDPIHLIKYQGMMIYLKALHTMAEVHKKKPVSQPKVEEAIKDTSMEDSLAAIEELKNHGTKANKTVQNKSTKGKTS